MAIRPPNLLLKEIVDPYSQENWYKLKTYLESLDLNIASTVTQTINTSSSLSPWITGSKSVGAGATEVVESIPLTNFTCVEYTICMKNAAGTLTKTLKMLARRDDMDIKDTIYAKNGDPINIEISSVQTGTDFQLTFVNNEAFSISVAFARLKL